MPKRGNSFAPIIPSLAFAFVATIAVYLCSPVRAETACIEQPSQPAAEGTHWSARYNRAKGRKCWFLVDANGHDVTASQIQPNAAPTPAPASSLSPLAQITSFLGLGPTANAAPQANTQQANTPQGDPAQNSPASVPRKRDGNAANAGKNDNGSRAEQKTVGEAHPVKPVSLPLTAEEREALFEEFLRWQENRQSASTLSPWPHSR